MYVFTWALIPLSITIKNLHNKKKVNLYVTVRLHGQNVNFRKKSIVLATIEYEKYRPTNLFFDNLKYCSENIA